MGHKRDSKRPWRAKRCIYNVQLLTPSILRYGFHSSGEMMEILSTILASAYVAILLLLQTACPMEDISQTGSINGIPIHEYTSCGSVAQYDWTYGIFLDEKLTEAQKEEYIQKELCHAKQTPPKNHEELIEREKECGHPQEFLSAYLGGIN